VIRSLIGMQRWEMGCFSFEKVRGHHHHMPHEGEIRQGTGAVGFIISSLALQGNTRIQ
jgi:hypothetical protein